MDESLPIFQAEARRAFTLHGRQWQSNRYVYPVVSRRSKGISVGINLNPDKVCNFDCIYCSVDRTAAAPRVPWASQDVDLGILREELAHLLEVIHSGEIYTLDPFDKIPQALRRINDIAFSGDGEPTTCPQFSDAVRLAADVLAGSAYGAASDVKLVLITNATMFRRPAVRETLAFLDTHNGEIWGKLDAGTAAYYDLVDRTPVPFSRVLENLRWCCQTRPTVIQTLFMKVRGIGPSDEEIAAYAEQLKRIVEAGGKIKLLQLYTVARRTTEAFATALTGRELDNVAQVVRGHVTGTVIESYA